MGRWRERVVVHCMKAPYDVLVDRTTVWGNPFPAERHGRAEAIRMYEKWLASQPSLAAQLPSLKGKVLGCWCAPLPCHADVLARLANG